MSKKIALNKMKIFKIQNQNFLKKRPFKNR